MATPNVPLNLFKLVALPLNSGSNIIYQQVENNVSAIILSTQITNISEIDQRVTVQIEKSGSLPITLLKNALIPPEESLNPLAGKVVLERTDKLIFIAQTSGSLEAVLSVLENAND
jgi:hypothetical protein